jgi:hypothetical protein
LDIGIELQFLFFKDRDQGQIQMTGSQSFLSKFLPFHQFEKKKRFCELLFGSPEHALEPSEFLLPFSLVFLLKSKKIQETSGMQMSSLVS